MSKTANITEFLNSKKVELSSDVVELGRLDDLKSLFDQIKAEFMKAYQMSNNVASSIITADNQIKELQNIKKQASELGLDSSKIDPLLKEMQDYNKKAAKAKSAADSLRSAFS